MKKKKPMTEMKRIRKEHGLRQSDVADKLGIHCKSYARYECGARKPTLEMLIAISKLLETTPDALLVDQYEEVKDEEE